MDLLPYIKERVCDPIGMENVGWGTVGGKGFIGPYCTPGGFSCSGRDHARFCYLAMHKGKWAGKQIVPASKDVPADFIQTHGSFHNDGCLIPSLDLVFVRYGRQSTPAGFHGNLVKRVLAAVEK
jgi:CubicO group peptidase (beta-lactamase class C family)